MNSPLFEELFAVLKNEDVLIVVANDWRPFWAFPDIQ